MDLGHAGLFTFLHRELGLSKGAAHYRKTAAELVQRFPEVVEPLEDGRLCITSIVELAKVLTPDNRAEVLPRFFHCSRREAASVAAEIRPVEVPPSREVVTAVRAPGPASALVRAEPPLAAGGPGVMQLEPPPAGSDARVQLVEPVRANSTPALAGQLGRPAQEPESIEPLTAELRRLHVTVSRRFMEKLESARAARSHARPGASAEAILEEALDLLLAREARKRGEVERPRAKAQPSKAGHIPAQVKREVWRRDGGRCQWRLESGGICGSTHRLELDHVVPSALGGLPTVGNLRLLCAGHNRLAARRVFGDACMDRYARRGAAARTPGQPVAG